MNNVRGFVFIQVTLPICCQVCSNFSINTTEELSSEALNTQYQQHNNSNSTTISTTQQYSPNNQDHTIQTTRINHTTISIINNTILKVITLNYDKMMGRKCLTSYLNSFQKGLIKRNMWGNIFPTSIPFKMELKHRRLQK